MREEGSFTVAPHQWSWVVTFARSGEASPDLATSISQPEGESVWGSGDGWYTSLSVATSYVSGRPSTAISQFFEVHWSALGLPQCKLLCWVGDVSTLTSTWVRSAADGEVFFEDSGNQGWLATGCSLEDVQGASFAVYRSE